MEEKNIIIIGMGSAAVGASKAIQQTNPKAKITLIEKKGYEMYSPCAMPFAFEDKLKFKDLKHEFPSRGFKTKFYLNTEAQKIDTEKKELLIKNEKGKEILKYDSLIIATGTRPFIPPIENIEKFLNSYAMPVNTLEDVFLLYSSINQARNKGSEATIIGAGAVGLEFAVAVKNKGIETLVVEMMPQALPNAIDSDMAKHVQDYLEEKSIKILTNSKVEKIKGIDKLESVIVNEKDYKTSFIILACGNIPNIELVKDTGISYSKKGIITNNRMRTNVKDVYAIGDCVETYNALTKKRCRSALAVPAINQGIVAGINAAGGKATYKGTLNTFISVLGNYAIGSTGLTTEQAKEAGYDLITQKIKGLTKPEWYPGHEELIVKVIADKKGKLLGGQVFGEKKAVKNRIDLLAMCLSMKGNVKRMENVEFAYCPDVANIPDPLTTALDFMLRRVKKLN